MISYIDSALNWFITTKLRRTKGGPRGGAERSDAGGSSTLDTTSHYRMIE